MDENEKRNLYETMKSVIESAINEKINNPKWSNKIKNVNIKAQLTLQVDKNDLVTFKLILDKGSVSFEPGTVENYDLELIADPEDLMWFCNKKYNTLTMLFKKNKFGFKKLRIKKGGRNAKKLLLLSKLLVFE